MAKKKAINKTYLWTQRVRAGGSIRLLRMDQVHGFQKLTPFGVVVVVNLADDWRGCIN